MSGLTVGQVAALMNAGVVIVQFTFPLTLMFILCAVLENENNAITWSVVARLLHGSLWPTILCTDSAAMKKVSRRTMFLSFSTTFGLISLTFIAIVTPLGLYETIKGASTQEVNFIYSKDYSPIGQASPSRHDYQANRLCIEDLRYANCPGQEEGFIFYSNGSGSFYDWDSDDAYISSSLSTNLTNLFSSRSPQTASTVASPFDIEYRTFESVANEQGNLNDINTRYWNIDQGRRRTSPIFRMYQSLLEENDYVVIDGMVIDTKNSSVGMRNHTMPEKTENGVEWTESLLWLAPETACVNTNLTIDFTVGLTRKMAEDVYIVDQGGIMNIPLDKPRAPKNNQSQLDLSYRAHFGAQLNNFNLMTFFNATRNGSFIGKRYSLNATFPDIHPFQVQTDILESQQPVVPFTTVDADYYIHPEKYEHLGWLRGHLGSSKANVSNHFVVGGLVLGFGRALDPGNLAASPGTNWSSPLYSCASVVSASVMDVTFFTNATNALSKLEIRKVAPKAYNSTAEIPLWAVETPGMNISEISPMWGLIDNKYENAKNLSTVRQRKFYLPAGSRDGISSSNFNGYALAGTDGPTNAMMSVFQIGLSADPFKDRLGLPEYSGLNSYSMFLQWQKALKSPEKIPTMLHRIWMDIMANYLTSTRSQLTNADSSSLESTYLSSTPVAVQAFEHSIQYDIRYAIPAFIFLLFYLGALGTALILWGLRRASFSMLRDILNQTALGRAVINERNGSAAPLVPINTKDWINKHGNEDLGITWGRNTGVNLGNTGDHGGDGEASVVTKGPYARVAER